MPKIRCTVTDSQTSSQVPPLCLGALGTVKVPWAASMASLDERKLQRWNYRFKPLMQRYCSVNGNRTHCRSLVLHR